MSEPYEAESLFKSLFQFEAMRAEAARLIAELEMSSMNVTYHMKTEEGVRQRLDQIGLLVAKMQKLLTPPAKPTNVT